MGDLFKEIQAGTAAGGQQHKIRELLAKLGDQDRCDLEAALSDPSISHVAIVDALTRRGHPVAQSTVGKWRREMAK